MVSKVNIEKKYFVDEKTGENKRYYEFTCVLDGQIVALCVRKDKKSLANYILDRTYKEEK